MAMLQATAAVAVQHSVVDWIDSIRLASVSLALLDVLAVITLPKRLLLHSHRQGQKRCCGPMLGCGAIGLYQMQAAISRCCSVIECKHARSHISSLLQEDVAAQEQAAQHASMAAAPSTAAAEPSPATAAPSPANVEDPAAASLADLSLQLQDDVTKPNQQTTNGEQDKVVPPVQHQVSPLSLPGTKCSINQTQW